MTANQQRKLFGKFSLKQGGIFLLALAIVVSLFVYLGPGSSSAKGPLSAKVDPAFGAYVSAYTSGVISKASTIRVRLAQETQDSVEIGSKVSGSIFKFAPGISGEAFWVDSKTIEFVPEVMMESGEQYKATLRLSELMEVPDELEDFQFDFRTITQNLQISIDGLKVYDKNDLKRQKLVGNLVTSDVANDEDVEKLLTAKQGTNSLAIDWDHQGDNNHQFTIEEIKRSETSSKVMISWNGDAIEVAKQDEMEIEVPALGDFKLLNVHVVQSPEQYLRLQFSDPIKENQELDGLINIGSLSSLRFLIYENEIRVYPPVRQTGKKTIEILAGIRNMLGYKMNQGDKIEVLFEQIKPAVRLVGKGVVLPSTDGLVLPFEAVSLKAVDVTIIKIFESNIAQFLQTNQLSGNGQLRRVGRPVVKKTVSLGSGEDDLGKWNRYTLDLNNLITSEPGAIYQVRLNFRPQHSVYDCPGQEGSETALTTVEEDWEETEGEEFSYWDSYEDYYYDPDYDWNERDNPCHTSYFTGNRRTVQRNILASNLGLIAKSGNDRQLLVAVTDLQTTDPLQGIKVEVYDYQQQLIQSTNTDGEGFALVELDKKPFLVIAKRGEERGYLKLDDGSSLSLSNFDVSGEKIQKGLKGFIYGERDVWRPGDNIYLSFILEDKNKSLPATHPVIFELINPQGQVEDKVIRSTSVHGFYNFTTKTSSDAITGNWQAKIKVGGATFQKRIKIETIKPNRLKIKLDFGTEKLTVNKSNVNGQLQVKWLHGAPARNLKAEFDVMLTQAPTKFSKYGDYIFDDQARRFYSESQRIFEGNLNEQGFAQIAANLSTESASPGMLYAFFRGKVYEESGNFSIDRFSIPYYPYSSFVGLRTPKGDRARGMLLTDTTHTVSIVTVDANGKPVSRSGVEVSLYKLNWRWWWDHSGDDIANYIGRNQNQVFESSKINTNADGKGTWRFRVDYPEWGRFYVRACDPVSGHCTGKVVYIDWPGWAGRGQRDFPGGASMLSFSADKEKYLVGEDVKITIPSSKAGRALVSIENGSRVIEAHWMETQQGETPFIFKVTQDMAPNIYINVSLVQPHSQTENDLPIRLYGVIPIIIDDPGTHLDPVIDMPDVLAPEKEVTITVSEKNKKAMAYTLAVVDEGLLDLTRFKTPDPWNQFYKREALGVKTWDLYEDVIGAYGGSLERLLSIGGDEAASGEKATKVNRFKPVVQFMGPFYLEPGEKSKHTFTMPQYIGSVRTMLIAGDDNGAYGHTEKATPVRQALMVLGTLPRVLGPDEEVKLPANVFAYDQSVKKVDIAVKANDLFTMVGPNAKKMTFDQPTDQITDFNLKVKPQIGAGKVEITATSGAKKATHTIDIAVRNPNPPQVHVIDTIVAAGQTWNADFQNVGMKGTNSGILEVSSIPPINFGRRLKYLLRYPHGCVEQTVSAAFPQLYLSDLMDLNETGEDMTEKNIKAAIDKLMSFQNSEGSFSYWPGRGNANDWGTNYAGHFLIEAKSKGYNVPADLINKWKKYQRRAAKNWRYNQSSYRTDLIQAYRLYTLALVNSPEKGAMNRLRERNDLSKQAKWRLAAAYLLIGQKEAARDLTNRLNTTIAAYTEQSYTYGSSLRDQAMILETYCLMDERTEGWELLKQIAKELSRDNYWMSTQTTAYCLIAASKFIGVDGKPEPLSFNFKLNNDNEIKASTELPFVQKELNVDENSNGRMVVSNNGSKPIFARIVLEGTPVAGNETNAENNLRLNVIYKTMNGQELDPTRIEQGTDFMVEVTVSNPGLRGHYKELALTQIFPSGWEIINTRMDDVQLNNGAHTPTYQDIRDDRVYTYFNLNANKRKTFRILLNASYAGKFYLPAINCEAMYDNTINARRTGHWVEVVKPGVQ
ncbi:MG2 domain-containing protein [Fulvivirgaceae bacterium BMA10]|uniref:MG2 domain-containing protein n=1 Tax=Splendidivirga corallicola TaxID=3051826 RepID=A0ABT8KS50_9BACT|nr:MG2 domain-containing protein [Fulvivirgaceae bacterium BMA10]